jgi:hypothetical protein
MYVDYSARCLCVRTYVEVHGFIVEGCIVVAQGFVDADRFKVEVLICIHTAPGCYFNPLLIMSKLTAFLRRWAILRASLARTAC